MPEAPRPPAIHRSVFVRLVATMVAMASGLLVLVTAFHFLVVVPSIHDSVSRVTGQSVRALAGARPDSLTAARLADSLGMRVHYVPADSVLPQLSAPTALHNPFAMPHVAYIVPAPQGGRYVFVRRMGRQIHEAHTGMMLLLLLLMGLVILTAHAVLRRALRPLRQLTEGATRLGEGDLDVEVPAGRDEFGALSAAFNRMSRRVRDMVRARDQLLLDVSHELRSPLARLKVALALTPEGPVRARMADDVQEMEVLVGGLLELERLRGGHGLRIAPADLAELARAAAAVHGNTGPGVRVVADSPLILPVDADRVRTVFRNLLENAARYTLDDSGPIEISIAREPGTVVVRVADDGPGIPVEAIDSLFEPFSRPDRSRTRDTGGYGLGLSLCRRILEAHGGTISVENRQPRGALFTLRFPDPG